VLNRIRPELDVFDINETIKHTARILGLSRDHIKKLERTFNFIDVGTSGSIDRSKFFMALGEEETVITSEILKLVDTGNIIKFEDFVQVCVTYCIYSQTDILKFCF